MAGRRRGRTGHANADEAAAWTKRVTTIEYWCALGLAAVMLPVAALGAAVDGRSWAPGYECTIDAGDGTYRSRVIEISHDGTGDVGWDTHSETVVNGSAGTEVSRTIREPWWRE